MLRRKPRPSWRQSVALVCAITCSVSTHGVAKVVEHVGAAGIQRHAEPIAQRSGASYDEMRERVLEADDGKLIAWFLGAVSRGGDQAWLGLARSSVSTDTPPDPAEPVRGDARVKAAATWRTSIESRRLAERAESAERAASS